jgi:putative ABC transport system permease protein
MSTLIQDARYASRMMLRAPGFTIVAVLALALGIGANTAIFSIVYGVFLDPLPFPEPARLVSILGTKNGVPSDTHSLPDIADLRTGTTMLEHVGGYANGAMTLSEGREAHAIATAFVDADLMAALAVPPLRGRSLSPADDARGAPRTVLISDGFWARRFDRDESAIGQPLRLDGQPYTVVGVMPPQFEFPLQPDRVQLWIPMRTSPFIESMANERGARFIVTLARVKPGVSIAQAQADADAVAGRLAQAYPASNTGRGVLVQPLRETLVGSYETAFAVLVGAVVFVLLIACANVANLLLARGAARRRELAVRLALGATRGRLVRQLLVESVLLALVGGTIGLFLAAWGVAAIVRVVPFDVPRLQQVSIDPIVLTATMVMSIATGVFFGLVPALQSSRPDVNEGLKDAARSSSGAHGRRTRSLLVVSEVSLAVLLLVGAGLLMRSFVRLRGVNPGFSPDHVLTAALALPESQYSSPEKIASFYRSLLPRLQAIPGVRHAAMTTTVPLTGGNISLGFAIEGRPAPSPSDRPLSRYFGVSPDFLRVFGIPLVAGRTFTEADAASPTPSVALVSESVARKYWPGGSPIGQRIVVADGRAAREIIGIVGDINTEGLDQRSHAEIYVLFPQRVWPFMSAVLRTSVDPLSVGASLRQQVAAVDPDLPIEKLTTMDAYVARSVADRRFTSMVLGSFALLAVTLSALGIYGVMACTVAQRTREIGIRVALGARPQSVLRLIVAEGMRTALAGIGIGLAGALALSRVLSTLVFGVGVRDALTFSAVSALLGGVALLACYVPARRAMRIDPTVALRTE